MKIGLYSKLAWNNIVKNKQVYLPYILTVIGTCAAMYILYALNFDPGFSQLGEGTSNGQAYVSMFMTIGIFLVSIFCFIFLIYTNSFLMKRRTKELGLYNTLWALILPSALSLYNAIITKTAMQNIPESLTESAYIDGANDPVILVRILLPLIGPTLAVMALYYGVGQWNSWFAATIYLSDNSKLPIQAVLRAILIANESILDTGMEVAGATLENSYAETIKYAVILISTVPILLVYPFLQKYFVNGVMIGAVKG